MSHVHFYDAKTGQSTTREMNVEEIAQIEESARHSAELEAQQLENQKRNAYAAESDPLFFKWQRGEGTEQAWLDKVAEIQARYPYPPAP